MRLVHFRCHEMTNNQPSNTNFHFSHTLVTITSCCPTQNLHSVLLQHVNAWTAFFRLHNPSISPLMSVSLQIGPLFGHVVPHLVPDQGSIQLSKPPHFPSAGLILKSLRSNSETLNILLLGSDSDRLHRFVPPQPVRFLQKFCEVNFQIVRLRVAVLHHLPEFRAELSVLSDTFRNNTHLQMTLMMGCQRNDAEKGTYHVKVFVRMSSPSPCNAEQSAPRPHHSPAEGRMHKMNSLFKTRRRTEYHRLSRQDMLCELIPSLLLTHNELVVEDGQVLHITALKPFLSLRPAKPTGSFLLNSARRPQRREDSHPLLGQVQDTAVHPWDVHHCAPTQNTWPAIFDVTLRKNPSDRVAE